MVDGEIGGLNKIQLETMCLQDKLRGVITNWDEWLVNNFNSLDGFRQKIRE
jgi:hypothetical protein